VAVFCICCCMLGSQILSAVAPAVGVFCFLVRSFMHLRCGSHTYLHGLSIWGRFISGICFFDIFLIFWLSKHVYLNPSMLTQHVCVPLFIEEYFGLGFHPPECGIPYSLPYLQVMCIAYNHPGHSSRADFAMGLSFGEESAAIASESLLVVESSLIKYVVPVGIVHSYSKSMQCFAWCFIWCMIAIVVNVCFQTFIW